MSRYIMIDAISLLLTNLLSRDLTIASCDLREK